MRTPVGIPFFKTPPLFQVFSCNCQLSWEKEDEKLVQVFRLGKALGLKFYPTLLLMHIVCTGLS
jgi:hypothetical protein